MKTNTEIARLQEEASREGTKVAAASGDDVGTGAAGELVETETSVL